MDTIFALASAPGKAGVSVVRISGPETGPVLSRLGCSVPGNGRGLRKIRASDGTIIDEALILHFAEGKSFTGEESAELQVHGSVAVINKLSAELLTFDYVRLAEPGEFSRRAFSNGNMDLAQVEGLADLIDAETEMQRKQAQRLFDGNLSAFAQQIHDSLLEILAMFTSVIDFSEEEIPDGLIEIAQTRLNEVLEILQQQIDGIGVSERIRDGFTVVILGAPNAGKSTLLNRLAGREAAIVSDIAGTTRDVVEVYMDVNGIPVTFIDTAGLRETDDTIEKIGIERAMARAENCDLRIILETQAELPIENRGDDIICKAKADINGNANGVSGLTGQGLTQLLDRVGKELEDRALSASLATNSRHLAILTDTKKALDDAKSSIDFDVVVASEQVSSAARNLDALVGKVGVEAVLGLIFSRFCIGK